jgi:hypothetical protein
MGVTMKSSAPNAVADEQRAHGRLDIRVAGKLFVPAEEATLDCTVINLSLGGAGLYCPEPPPLDAFVILYVEGFGRFECVTTRFVKGELGLKFLCKDAKRKRLEQDLAAFVRDGVVGVTRLRRHPRAATANKSCEFTRADGQREACELQDISFQGAMLKTAARPAIGEVIQLGQTRGWVIRHHKEGIGVQFQQQRPDPVSAS